MPPAGSEAPKKWRILCIDDEPDILEILRVTLGLKHEVVTAQDGLEAVEMLDLCEADFVLCDVRMPRMDGFQTVEAIRRHPLYLQIPVFFLTAETAAEMAKRGYASGANLYLTKPFDPMRVLQNIDYFLEESGLQPRPKRFSPEQVYRELERRKAAGVGKPGGAADLSKVRIILVCYQQDQLERFRKALASSYECVACADPLAALQQLFRYDPDLLMINPAIPHLSGWGLVQMIRNNPHLKTLRILLIQDDKEPLDARLVPSITKYPALSEHAPEKAIAAAVRYIIEDAGFQLRPKRASIAEITAEEEKLRRQMEQDQRIRQGQEDAIRARYRKIQAFIDRNLT